MLRDTLFKLVNRLFKVLDIRFDIGEEGVEQVADIIDGVQLEVDEDALLVLVKDGRLAIFKDRVYQGIFVLNLFRNLFLQIALGSLSLPIAAANTKLIQQHAIGSDLAQRHLRGKLPANMPGNAGQQI